jgi:hypothetical protein
MPILKGTVTFLFDGGQLFAEGWDMDTPTAADAMQRLERIAAERLGLLGRTSASCSWRCPVAPNAK